MGLDQGAACGMWPGEMGGALHNCKLCARSTSPLYFLKSSGRFANTSFCSSSFQTGQSAEGMSDAEEQESI